MMTTTERLDSPTIEEMMIYPFNRIELRLAESGVKERSAAERDAIAEMVRTRGAAYAARFRHAAELSWRMPEMYWTAQDDGRMTIDHMDAIWRRMDRHTGLRELIDRRGPQDQWDARFPEAESPYSTSADLMVERAVVEWLRECPHRLITVTGSGSMRPRSTVTIHRLREVVDTTVAETLELHRRYDDEDSGEGSDRESDRDADRDADGGESAAPVGGAPF
ncbi:MAG TPA: hypothetical protein H9870_08300 [Candidatus Corynebacterium avicola]|uniref:Uncharacterized protein n=1 Tax=Candidatus Corynebacterium avicola TaxID=2838527 RepID=A0A9D1RQE8_9CORY|nr:hypothetical protein [Candidatus Corynebacterium avicola]